MADVTSILQDMSSDPPSSVPTPFSSTSNVDECSVSPNARSDEEWDFLDDFKPLIPLPAELALETGKNKEISDGNEEWEVLDDLKLLSPLPAEIALETGKYEEVLFENQANLYKFVDLEWKEQYLCTVKILHNSLNRRVRLLMRKEEVLKTSANHCITPDVEIHITPDTEIHPLKNFDQSWRIAQEFVNEELEPEEFCICFNEVKLSAAFKVAFMKAWNIAKGSVANNLISSKVTATDSRVISKPFRSKFSYPAPTWFCPLCETNNVADKFFCVICETTKPSCCGFCEYNTGNENRWCSRERDIYSSFPILSDINIDEDSRTKNLCSSKVPTTDSLVISELFGLKSASTASSWCCPLCETNNEADKRFCVSCEKAKPFCCSECNIYAMLSDDSMSSDDENYNN